MTGVNPTRRGAGVHPPEPHTDPAGRPGHDRGAGRGSAREGLLGRLVGPPANGPGWHPPYLPLSVAASFFARCLSNHSTTFGMYSFTRAPSCRPPFLTITSAVTPASLSFSTMS